MNLTKYSRIFIILAFYVENQKTKLQTDFSPENWDPEAIFEYRTISVRSKVVGIFAKQTNVFTCISSDPDSTKSTVRCQVVPTEHLGFELNNFNLIIFLLATATDTRERYAPRR